VYLEDLVNLVIQLRQNLVNLEDQQDLADRLNRMNPVYLLRRLYLVVPEVLEHLVRQFHQHLRYLGYQ
jgi:hypothetical protein